MTHFSLGRFFNNKRGLGAPVGNLIILAAAVVLSTTVVLFAVNVTTNQVQKESLFVADATVTTKTANITISNTGPTAIRVAQITVRGEKFANYTSFPDIATGLVRGNSTTITVTLTDNLITANDIGRPVVVVISTTQGAYFTETLIEGSINSTPAATDATPSPSETPP
jgi:hypothetical protein